MLKQYFKYGPEKIIRDVCELKTQRLSNISGIELLIDPNVYPSDRFRSSRFLVDELTGILDGVNVCDMGCGPGIVGLVAMYNGAKNVVQVDINPHAVNNARSNRSYHSFEESQLQVYESDCFDNIPSQKFDYILYNPPFHSEKVEIKDPIERAFIDPGFASFEKFLDQSKNYLEKDAEVIIAFSNKGDTQALESLFTKHGFSWRLWKVANVNVEFDSRLYQLKNN
ncbi:MAG: Ribosomal RNA large subunit methyltransferase G [Chlamydiae bacterium]|nr:Ribosomal RNA large subunit methyltransferase G [Chlamydiota bacterium]